MKPKLKIWVLSDGKPGHFNQSKGMLEALEHHYQIDSHWLEIKLQAKPLRWLLKLGLNSGLGLFSKLCRGLYRWQPPKPADLAQQGPDLILSMGGNTSFLNIALAQYYQCNNFFIGSLRGLKPQLFTRFFTIEDWQQSNNIIMPLPPSPSSWQQQRQAAQQAGLQAEQHLCLLVGGPNKEYRFSQQDWFDLAKTVNRLAEQTGKTWLISTSRRTPLEAEKMLAKTIKPQYIQRAVWYRQKEEKIMAAFLGASSDIFCSEDSMSMISEGIAAGKPVYSLQGEEQAPNQRYEAALDNLSKQKLLARQRIIRAKLDPTLTPLPQEPGRQLAEQIRASGWQAD